MRMQLLKIVVVLLVAGSGDTRPQNGADSQAKTIERNDAGWRGIQVSSKSHDIVRDDSSGQPNDTHRELKDLQYMDQSLRTVATQLLNVTNPEDVMTVNNKELIQADLSVATTPKSSEKNNVPTLIRDVSSEISNLEPVSFGRPINSKFSYFETGHPGQAMAMTEEELEREMSTTRLITAYKNHPTTTTGGISTWILLNPPSTTVKSVEIEKSKTQQPFQTEVRLTVRPSSTIEKVETISQPEKITEKTTPQLTPVITTEKVTVITKKPAATTTKKITTTSKPERVTQDSEKAETSSSTTLKVIRTTTTSTSTTTDGTATLTTVLTTKKSQPPRTTPKPKVTTPRPNSKPTTIKSTTTKPTRSKPTRKTTIKPETVKNETSASTGKIEKVTFKPVPIITTPQDKPEITEKPMFVTKIKASVLMDTQKTPTTVLPATTASTTLSVGTTYKSNLLSADLVEVPVRSKPIGTKGNNVLKVQLKKPVDETTQIEIEPIKVNAPILTIEKIDKNKMGEILVKDTDDLSNSKIDLKFDFNPELTKINVETRTESSATPSTSMIESITSTTKRPRHNSKRKKNKNRRRKPATSSAPSSTTPAMMPVLLETSESVTDSTIMDNAVQESKIAPETKVGANTKTKKKQPQKAIGTQIYNFLSREVMPSFGVMSLVGLGLGLASYFLYPFGGTITRRNYDVEPNYKYNMDEYGGNYGQSEEEMLSKVFQGMTNYENKYPGAKDNYNNNNNNYYHYQHYDGAYDTQTTKKIESRYPSAVSTSPVYKTAENTQPAVKYRNTDFRYPEVQTTPVYYDRKRPDLTEEVSASSAANRQFVVGNVPKEYPFDVKVSNLPVDSKKGVGYMSTEVGQTQFERDVAQGFDFPNVAGLHGYGHPGASTVRPDDGYEEIEITPTAVAVEHGPRSFKVKRAALNEPAGGRRRRLKRESVIQIIPSKRELEEERKEVEEEEDLSNEILDIIDSALPGGGVPTHKTKGSGENEVEDLEGQKRKQQEEANTRAKESTMKTIRQTEETTEIPTTMTVEKTDDGGTSISSENFPGKDTTHPAKDPEVTTVEWFDSSTTKKPSEGFSLLNFVKKVAEIKFRLGLTILKHASEGFARYLGHVQKRINGEE